ncbi:MAG: HAD-IA family hydrolase [Aquificae bacterium]|nr:HAD-IA family hydrolase [Aquificota bacterium]
MVELVVFDLDGTLIDTAPDLYAAFCDTAAEYGLKPPPYEEFCRHIGGGAYGFLEPFFPKELLEEALQRLRRHYLEKYAFKNSRPYEGIYEVLETLKGEGYKLAVATNKITEGALRVLKAARMDRYFDLVVGRDLPPAHKPDPAHVLFLTERLGVSPRKTLVVGDRSDDVLAAKGAGALSAYALWGYAEPLDGTRPDFLLKRPKEVLSLVRELRNRRPEGGL